jgi:hypothetical protein
MRSVESNRMSGREKEEKKEERLPVVAVSVAVPAAPFRVPSQRPFAPSIASVTLVTNDKDGNEMILGAVHRSPDICLTAEENPRRPFDEGTLRPAIASNGVPFLQMRS